MIYVFVDTNIWVRVLSQGRPGCELEHLGKLIALVGESKVTLILPEVVTLELERCQRAFTDDIATHFIDLSKAIEDVLRKKKLAGGISLFL